MDAMLYAKELVMAGIVALYLALFAYYRQGRWGWYHSRVLALIFAFIVGYYWHLIEWYYIPLVALAFLGVQFTLGHLLARSPKDELSERAGMILYVVTFFALLWGESYAKKATVWLPLVGILIERIYFLYRCRYLATPKKV